MGLHSQGVNGTAWITDHGWLLVQKTQDEYLQSNFCVSRNSTGGLVSVTCTVCTKDRPCIKLCCPHGYVRVNNNDFDINDYNSAEEVCGRQHQDTDLGEDFWERYWDTVGEWTQGLGLVLTAPAHGQETCQEKEIQEWFHFNENHTE